MDEQRLQAYLELIQQLLACPSGEESAILEANSELVDAQLVQVMEAVAQRMVEEGEENGAAFLRDVAQTLTRGEQFSFLMKVLRATLESGGNAEVVYPLLRDNLDKLNDRFGELLREWATATFAQVDPQQAQRIVLVIGEFSNLIQQFPLGSRTSNLEIAITGYEVAAEVFTRQVSPEVWATLQNNLGNAYFYRIRGERADNLEAAIAAFTNALEVRTREAFPIDWAGTQNNLGNAYSERIQGDRAENLEQGITAYNAALEVFTAEEFPQVWAETQINLGDSWLDRFDLFHQTEDLNCAIEVYQKVLDGQGEVSSYRSLTLYRLGKALFQRGSFNQAIEYLEQARTLLEQERDVNLLAFTFFLLARLYHRISRLGKARLYFKDALRLFRRLGDERAIAEALTALGNLELQMGRFTSASDRLQQAKVYYQETDKQERVKEIDNLLELARSKLREIPLPQSGRGEKIELRQ